jgi:hypothetical protein
MRYTCITAGEEAGKSKDKRREKDFQKLFKNTEICKEVAKIRLLR